MLLRNMQPADNQQVAHIIRTVMTEFGAVGTGYSIEDAEVDTMFESFDNSRSAYYVIVDDQQQIIGCGGIAPLADANDGTCELKKMYFLPIARGHGWGKKLIATLEADAYEKGYRIMYLETIARMETANHLYQKSGFIALSGKMGNTGHSSCGLFYMKQLSG
jgi:putative acetyltransferase